MFLPPLSRRSCFGLLTATAALSSCAPKPPEQAAAPAAPPDEPPPDHERRIQWWRQAKFGMFIHWGLYSVLGRHEWVMENEGIPTAEYEALAAQFRPKPNFARAWAKLAKQAGMKYMVMTSKHHEGFGLFDTKLTTYCAPRQAAGRDLAAEFLDAARAEGLRAGFYYSLMDWHHPDGARCRNEEAARRRFVDYIHGQIRELCTQYGKLDILWYDVAWPLDAAGWESEAMNRMVFDLQPDILVNNRNLLAGDFSTSEQRIVAEAAQDWEACMTMNGSWGYHPADDDWKTPKTIVRNLVTCARDGGNYLLNIGPRADGSIPEESVRILTEVGRWMGKNGATIYGAPRCQVRRSNYCNFTRQGNTLYVHVHFWPGSTVTVAGLKNKITSARLLASGQPVTYRQDGLRVRFTGLPAHPPDRPVTVIAAECDGEPPQDMNEVVRIGRARAGV